MPTPGWIRIVIFLAAAAMFGISLITGLKIDEQGLRWIGGVTAGITLLLLGFDRWFWRWPLFRLITEMTGSRVLHGTWRGTLDYTRDGDGNPGTIPFYMAIHQTYSRICVDCYFPTTGAVSWSLAAELSPERVRHRLRYIFQQQAQAPDLDHNRPTQGACDLAVLGHPVEEIVGSYYTERGGKGKISFDGRSIKVAGSAGQAERLVYEDLLSSRHGQSP